MFIREHKINKIYDLTSIIRTPVLKIGQLSTVILTKVHLPPISIFTVFLLYFRIPEKNLDILI